jgi:hypothetical protein
MLSGRYDWGAFQYNNRDRTRPRWTFQMILQCWFRYCACLRLFRGMWGGGHGCCIISWVEDYLGPIFITQRCIVLIIKALVLLTFSQR